MMGLSPLSKLGLYDLNKKQGIVNVLLQANLESQPAVLDGPSYDPNTNYPWFAEVLDFFNVSHGLAEGRLSLKIAA